MCLSPRFGSECEGQCPNCTDPRTECDSGISGTGECKCISPQFINHNGTCVCAPGYFGDNCLACPTCTDPFRTCSFNGTCDCTGNTVENEISLECECNEFTAGPYCNITCDESHCSSFNATCDLGPGGTGECVCLYPRTMINNTCQCDDGSSYGNECTPCDCQIPGQTCDSTGECSCEQREFAISMNQTVCACFHGYSGVHCNETHVQCNTGAFDPITLACVCNPVGIYVGKYCNETVDEELIGGTESSSSTGLVSSSTGTTNTTTTSSDGFFTTPNIAMIAVGGIMGAVIMAFAVKAFVIPAIQSMMTGSSLAAKSASAEVQSLLNSKASKKQGLPNRI
jgi:hypothetical protein